jgi:hypothetical protein
MATLRGSGGQHTRKYEVDLYLRRDGVRHAIDEFLQSSRTVFALGGSSGFGKTNEICALAEELGETHVVLFFNGADLVGPVGQVLADAFDWHFSEALPLPQICRRLGGLAARSGRPVLIIIDAVDEVADLEFPRELADLAARLDAFAGQIRLVVSAKLHEWRRFTEVRGNPSQLYDRVFVPPAAAPGPDSQEAGRLAEALPLSALVGPFTPSERDRAVAAYSTAFGLSDAWPYHLRELARDPFMLRMIAEVGAASGTVPRDPGERELVRRYVEAKVGRATNPERSRLELIAVATALARTGREARDRTATPLERTALTVEVDPTGIAGRSSVSESDVRTAAGLSATQVVADDLVGFGVLLRSRDRDGNARLTFAYDRVRDYMVATHAFGLPELSRERFRDATHTYLETELGVAALEWYLPYTTDEQWTGFVDAATRRAERLLASYEALREHTAAAVRGKIEPHTSGAIGLAFSATRHRYFALAFFCRETENLARVYFDPSIGDFNNRDLTGGKVPLRLMGSRQMKSGFWFLRSPEQYAASRMKEELERVVKEGLLVEADDTLVEERVVALAIAHASKLNLRPHAPRRLKRLADHFVGTDLFPLDLKELRRSIQAELGFEWYKHEHMRERYEDEVRKHRNAGGVPKYISFTSSWTPTDLQDWRERASSEVKQGQDFTDRFRGDDELVLLARAVNALLERKQILEAPLLPAPDTPNDDPVPGAHNFEDGFTDDQLARLIEVILDRGLRAYDRVMSDSFSKELGSLFPQPPQQLGVLCFRLPPNERVNSQFGAAVESGAASPIDAGVLDGKRAVAATVTPGGSTRLQRVGANAWDGDTIVTTTSGRYRVKVRRHTMLVSVVWPSDAPPFLRKGSNSAARVAPVRAFVYEQARAAVKELSVEQLRALASRSPE